jgi:hypothetical protein
MNNLQRILQYIEVRNRILTPELKTLQSELETVLEKVILEAGVINPGYFSYFVPVLNNWISSKIIERFHISEDGHQDGLTGQSIKIPVVDVFHDNSNYRIFVLPQSLLHKNGII